MTKSQINLTTWSDYACKILDHEPEKRCFSDIEGYGLQKIVEMFCEKNFFIPAFKCNYSSAFQNDELYLNDFCGYFIDYNSDDMAVLKSAYISGGRVVGRIEYGNNEMEYFYIS